MKIKFLFLALLFSVMSFGQTTLANKLKILNNTKDNFATRVLVQDSITKEVKWILKSGFTVSETDPNSVHLVGEQTIGAGEKTFQDNVNFANITVSGAAYGVASANPNAFVINSQIVNGWSLTGNAGTNPTTNYIGTSDDVDLIFKRNNKKRLGFEFSNAINFYDDNNSSSSRINSYKNGSLTKSSNTNYNGDTWYTDDEYYYKNGASYIKEGNISLFNNSYINTKGGNFGIGTKILPEKLTVNGYSLATGYKIPSGLSTQYLMADGSISTGSGSGDSIPLSGTTVGNPVTGDIEVSDGFKLIINDGSINIGGLLGNIVLPSDGGVNNAIINYPITSSGLSGEVDYSPNITDLDYPQATWVKQRLALKPLDEGNGVGWAYGTDRTLFGNIGLDAIDFSYSDTVSSTLGATGENSFNTGINNTSSGYVSSTFGFANTTGALGGFTTGFNNLNSGYTNFVTGTGHDVTGMSMTVVGQASNVITQSVATFNEATSPVFVVGNGVIEDANPNYTVASRSDALIVRKNGVVEVPSQSIAEINAGTDRTLVTKEYVDTKLSEYLQPETVTFYNNTLTSGGTIKQSDLLAIDNFILNGKTSGWWTAQKDMCLFLKTNGGVNSAIVKLKNTTNTSITNNGYTNSDLYDFGLFSGGTFNTGKYLSLGVTMSSLGIDLQNLSTAVFTPLEESGDYRFGLGDPNNKLGSIVSLFVDTNTVPAFAIGCNNGDRIGAYDESNLPLGVNVITCRADGLTSFNNGVNFKDTASIGSGTIGGTFETSRRSYGGGAAYTGNIPLSFYSIGTSLTNQQSLDMSKAIHALMVSLGRISPTNNLLSFGDSILKGYAEWNVQKTYANQVARKLSMNNINMSRGERISSAASGDVISGLNAYQNLLDFAPKTSTVLFALGTNDILTLDSNSNDFGNTTNLSNFNNHCNVMLSSSFDKGQNVILVSVAKMTNNLTTASLNKQLDYVKVTAALAKNYHNRVNGVKVNFINLYHHFLDSDVNYLLDGIHFNEEGNLAASKEILRVINTGIQKRNTTLSFGTINAGESTSINVTVLNAEVGMPVKITPPNNLTAGLVVNGFVSANDTVTVRLTNVTGSNISVLDGKFIVEVETGY